MEQNIFSMNRSLLKLNINSGATLLKSCGNNNKFNRVELISKSNSSIERLLFRTIWIQYEASTESLGRQVRPSCEY